MRVKIPFINFIGIRRYAFLFSLLILVVGIVFYFIRGGFNMGIDFKGGIVAQVKTSDKIDIHAVRKAMEKSSIPAQIQDLGAPSAHEFLIKTPSKATGNVEAVAAIEKALVDNLGAENVVLPFEKTDVVGPSMSKYMTGQAFWLVLLSMLCIFIYVSVRFKWDFALGGIISLFHDPMVVLTAMLITNKEIAVSIVAAILTLIGYSINDTIVIYDRIRELLKKEGKRPFREIIDLAVNQTLSRSILTSLTVFFVLMVLYLFGGAIISDFSLIMLIGVVIGSYSTIFIAAPIILVWEGKGIRLRK